MKAYIQLIDNHIITVIFEEAEGFIEVQLPENFDYSHIDWYEYVDGELIYHDRSDEYPVVPSQEERITSLENRLDVYEASYASGVQEA